MSGVDTSVVVAGVKFKNPIVAASGHPTHNGELLKKCIEAGVGAVETKSISNNPEEWIWPRPACWFTDKYSAPGSMTMMEMAFRTPEEGVADIKAAKAAAVREGAVIIGDISAPWDKPEMFAELAQRVEDAGADMIEFIGACPVGTCDVETRNAVVRDSFTAIIMALKEAVSVPIMAKFFWNDEAFVRDALKICEKAGVDVVNPSPFIPGVLINIETGRPILPTNLHYGPHWRPTGNLITAIARNTLAVPNMSSGGLWTTYDIIERLMAGASLAAVHTAIEYKGYGEFPKYIKGLEKFMETHGYATVDEMIGIAAPHIGNDQEFAQVLQETLVPKESLTLVVDEESCNGCNKCSVCNFGAITVDGVAHVDLELCERCGACASMCPTDALTIIRLSDGSNQNLDQIMARLGS